MKVTIEEYKTLIDDADSFVEIISEDKIESSECALLFGTNSIGLLKREVEILRSKNHKVTIYIIGKASLKDRLGDNQVKYIIWNDRFSCDLVPQLRNYVDNKLDTIFFYTQQPQDLGNLNILKIITSIAGSGIKVYAITREYELVRYLEVKRYIALLERYILLNNEIEDNKD